MAGSPQRIGQDISSAPQAPSIKTVSLNGRTVQEGRLSSINVTGPVEGGGTLRYDVAWREVLGGAAYAASFEVPADRLSRFESGGPLARIEIELGPGADVTVRTPNPELLRQAARGTPGAALGDEREPIVLQRLCAGALPAGDPRLGRLSWELSARERERAEAQRARALSRGAPSRGRCG